MRIKLTLSLLSLLLLAFQSCTDESVLEIIGDQNNNPTTGNKIQTFSQNFGVGTDNTSSLQINFLEDGNLEEVRTASNANIPPIGSLSVTTVTTFQRDSNGRITQYQNNISTNGQASTNTYNVTYNNEGLVTQIEEVNADNTSRITNFTHETGQINGEQRNENDEPLSTFTLATNGNSFPNRITTTDLVNNNTYLEEFTVESGNLSQLRLLKDDVEQITSTFLYDSNPNPLNFGVINNADIQLGILQAYAATNFTEPVGNSSFTDRSIVFYSTNNPTQVTIVEQGFDDEIQTYTYQYNQNNYPVSFANQSEPATINGSYTYF